MKPSRAALERALRDLLAANDAIENYVRLVSSDSALSPHPDAITRQDMALTKAMEAARAVLTVVHGPKEG